MGQIPGILKDPISTIERNTYLEDWVNTGLDTLEGELLNDPKLRFAFMEALEAAVKRKREKDYAWVDCWLFETGDKGPGNPDDDIILIRSFETNDDAVAAVNELIGLGYFRQYDHLTLWRGQVDGDFLRYQLFEENISQFTGLGDMKGLYIFKCSSCTELYDFPLTSKVKDLTRVYVWGRLKNPYT